MEEAAGASGGKRDHEEMSHVMALVEAARKVRTIERGGSGASRSGATRAGEARPADDSGTTQH